MKTRYRTQVAAIVAGTMLFVGFAIVAGMTFGSLISGLRACCT